MHSPYFELASRLWAEHDRNPLSHSAIVLYFRLLHEANLRFWKGPIVVSWSYLLGVLEIGSRSTLLKAISNLKSRGLIEYWREGKKSAFWFPDLPQDRSVQSSVQKVYQSEPIGTESVPKSVPITSNGTLSVPKSVPKGVPISVPKHVPISIGNISNTGIQEYCNTKDREGNNNSTPSGVLKDPILQNGTLPIECRGIPCGKIVELYSFYFGKPMRISSYIAKLIRERHTENPELDWKSFFQFVAEKNRQLTLTQILTSRNFYTLLKEFREIQEFDEKLERARKRAELEERRMGGIAHIGNLLGRRNHADGDLR